MTPQYRRLVAWITALTDIPIINLGFALAYWMRYDLQWFKTVEQAFYVSYRTYIPSALALTALLMLTYKLEGVYDPTRNKGWIADVYAILNATATGILLMVCVTFFSQPLYFSRLIFIYAAFLIMLLLSLARMIRSLVLSRLRQRGVGVNRVLIVGAGEVGRTVMANLVAQPKLGYELIGFVDDNPDKGLVDLGPFRGLGSTERLPQLITDFHIDEVFITLPWMYHRKIMSILSHCSREGVRARIVPDLFQMRLRRVEIEDLNGIPMLSLREQTLSGSKLVLKRTIDFLASGLALTILSPLFGLVALAIKLDSSGPVFFKQTRVGKEGREFEIYKFRSMRVNAEEELARLMCQNEAVGPLFKMRQDPRRTRVGKFLRKTSIDELPQFYNVLRGEMSLVGPRPPLPREVACYQAWQRKRLEVAPGMTGLPQVSGRSNLTFDETAFLDLYYIENWSLGLDISILLRTVPQLLFGAGAF